MRLRTVVAVALVLASAGFAWAQGVQTGVVTGTVTSTDGQSLPGVLVTITSDALIGTRTATTDTHGGYIFKGLPSGVYKVTFTRERFATVEKTVKVDLAAYVTTDTAMSLATVQETVNVESEVPTPLSTSTAGANYKQSMYDNLPTGRTLAQVAALSPGLSTNTPNADQVTISGNFAYDNVFLVDGADVNDNLFGSPNNIFIEDAIEEMQILTSGISAEFGRFGGGVINAITKRGGNTFTGSLRGNFTNPSWRKETPYEVSKGIKRQNTLNKFWEGTLGGPAVKDRVWFFVAGRRETSSAQFTLADSGLPFTQKRTQNRGEAKLSGAITQNHNLSATYLGVSDTIHRLPFNSPPSIYSIDPEHCAYDGKQPSGIFVVSYNGVLRPNLFLDLQYSQKAFEFKDSGGTSPDMIDSPYLGVEALYQYNAPYFDATDPEQRNNRQLAGSLSYFLSSEKLGKHDIKIGYEDYRSRRTGGNSQSSTGYVFYADYLKDDAGSPVFENGYVVPTFVPEYNLLAKYVAIKGAKIDLKTRSVYINDRWVLNKHWSFNIGARAEWAGGEATGGIQPVKASRIVPRLGASFDVRGDGKYKLDATYAHYAGKYSETQFSNNTNVGNPDGIYYAYVGPAGQGRDFAPGIDPNNYVPFTATIPTANVFYDKDIKSPVTKEWTAAAGTNLGSGGYAKLIYTHRNVTDFVQTFVDRSTGTTAVSKYGVDVGTVSNQLWKNSNDGRRVYSALQLQAAYQPLSHLRLEGHYTIQLQNEGNQEGEAANNPGLPSPFPGYYPEIFNEARSYPMGRLDDFQRHRVRAWGTYDLALGKAGTANLSLLYRFDSGSAYSLRSANVEMTSVQEEILAQYYPDSPGTQTLFYAAGRGSENYESSHLFDFAVNYNIPVWRKVRPWVKVEVRNVLDSTPLIGYNITVSPKASGPVDALGLATEYTKGKSFGTATSTVHFPNPRELFLSAGIRF